MSRSHEKYHDQKFLKKVSATFYYMTKQAKQELSSTDYNVNQPREDLSMKICGTERCHQPEIAGNKTESGQRGDCEQTADAGLQHKCQGLTGYPVLLRNRPNNDCRGHNQRFPIAPRRMQIIEFG